MSDYNNKKILLYYFSSSELLAHKTNSIKKINETLDIFLQSKDKISILWYHNPQLDEYIKERSPEIWNEYLALEDRFQDCNIGTIIKDSSKEDSLVEVCDAYYGSGGYLATSCANSKKPVMIQDISTTSCLSW